MKVLILYKNALRGALKNMEKMIYLVLIAALLGSTTTLAVAGGKQSPAPEKKPVKPMASHPIPHRFFSRLPRDLIDRAILGDFLTLPERSGSATINQDLNFAVQQSWSLSRSLIIGGYKTPDQILNILRKTSGAEPNPILKSLTIKSGYRTDISFTASIIKYVHDFFPNLEVLELPKVDAPITLHASNLPQTLRKLTVGKGIKLTGTVSLPLLEKLQIEETLDFTLDTPHLTFLKVGVFSEHSGEIILKLPQTLLDLEMVFANGTVTPELVRQLPPGLQKLQWSQWPPGPLSAECIRELPRGLKSFTHHRVNLDSTWISNLPPGLLELELMESNVSDISGARWPKNLTLTLTGGSVRSPDHLLSNSPSSIVFVKTNYSGYAPAELIREVPGIGRDKRYLWGVFAGGRPGAQ